ENIHAERDQPPFDRVTMDGIAVSSASLSAGQRSFRLQGTQGAGQAGQELHSPANCIEIMTGAVLPTGSDTVIPVERVQAEGARLTLEDGYTAVAGQFVHRRGTDQRQDEVLLEPGCRINGPEMAILTAAGKATVKIAQWPSLAVISTGDELVDVGKPITDFQIRSSNDRAIAAALQARGGSRIERARLPDEPDALRTAIEGLHARHDVLILSGGVSMGKYDYIPGILEALGVEVVFHKILQRPGLPMWFGTSQDAKPVFALPGNPVSTLVCLSRYVLPAIELGLGLKETRMQVRLNQAVDFSPDLCWFLPVKLGTGPDGLPEALPKPTNTSGDFVGLRGTDGFIELTRGSDHFAAGTVAPFFPW
ncbi:MAG: molybdopterin molybdotransferase MoeA, partial [Gammaproteobacteria bacterium]